MEPIIRVLDVTLQNFKNVRYGKVTFPSSKSMSVDNSDVLGVYGQNGSGKTAIVEAFGVLKTFLQADKFPNEFKHLIYSGEQTASLQFSFLVQKETEQFILEYTIDFGNLKDKAVLKNESLRYKKVAKGVRIKELISYSASENSDFLNVRNPEKIKGFDSIVDLKVSKSLAQKEKTSYLFRKDTLEILERNELQDEYYYLSTLKFSFCRNLHIVTNESSGLIYANIILPIAFQMENSSFDGGGTVPFEFDGSRVIPKNVYEMAVDIFEQINIVLTKVIPGLTVELNDLGRETDVNGKEGVRVEILSNRNGIKLPFWCESDGIKKLFSILSTLITMFNKSNSCIIIDELDAGIFEFLLGEIIEILEIHGKGQLLFTSHNLRLLEVLSKECLFFTTTNPDNRYIKLSGLTKTNNLRDVYIRAIQLGGQVEEIYHETDSFYLRQAFRKAGEIR
ncbi:AAA family ATPase [Sporosarcina siberiensis]|uniref:AAA family ATPase n=1 Tax=Sporosarcina siberiensis TaxID=1365606 RepID=A0ABW4SDM0_9BACL